MFTDNLSTYHLAHNPIQHQCIELDCHIIRDEIQDGVIKLLHIPNTQQFADVTKPLATDAFSHLVFKMNMWDIHAPLEGCNRVQLLHNCKEENKEMQQNKEKRRQIRFEEKLFLQYYVFVNKSTYAFTYVVHLAYLVVLNG